MLPEEQYKMIHRLLVRPYHKTEQLKNTDSTKAHTFRVVQKKKKKLCKVHLKTITWNSKTISTYKHISYFIPCQTLNWDLFIQIHTGKHTAFIPAAFPVNSVPTPPLWPFTFHLYRAKLLWLLHQSGQRLTNETHGWELIVWLDDPAGAVVGFEYFSTLWLN